MSYELTGKVKLLQDAQTFGSGFEKREIIVTVEDEKYPQDINLEFVQDRVPLLDGIAPGQEVTITFDIRGREYNGRYFNNLVGWKIQAGAVAHGAPAGAESAPVDIDDPSLDEDLPF